MIIIVAIVEQRIKLGFVANPRSALGSNMSLFRRDNVT